MATASWHSLDPPLNEVIVSVIKNEFHFEKMTPVQVSVITMFHNFIYL